MSEWTDEEMETANAGLRAAERLDDLEGARAEVAALTCLLETTRRELDDARSGRDIAAVYDELVKVQDELAEVRAGLKRYADVYADPDGPPLSMPSCEVPDERPLTGIAAAAQLRIDAMLRGEEPPSWEDALGGDVCLGREHGIEDGPTSARRPSPDRQHLIDLYGCAGEEALFDLLVKTECERLRREGLMREFEDLLIMDERTPEQAERLRVLDATLVLGGVPWPADSIDMIKAQRFIEQVTATLGKKTRHGEGE